ncbi:MAG: hypothetical protein AAFY41_03795 [Bacteroidota bacterium]
MTQRIFRTNMNVILVPGLFFGVALILRNSDLPILTWTLLGIGAITTVAVISSFTTIRLTDELLSIKNLRKSYEIPKNDIVSQNCIISHKKGIETIIWKLYLNGGGEVTISSDLIKEKELLKQELNQFLKRIPK